MNGTYAGIGGAGGAYEDEKAALASSPCIGKFKGLGQPVRGRIHPLVAATKTSVELMALKSNISSPIACACQCQETDCMLFCAYNVRFVYCPSTFNVGLTCLRSNLDSRWKNIQSSGGFLSPRPQRLPRTPSCTSSSPRASFLAQPWAL